MTFNWSACGTSGVTKWWLYVGTTENGKDILDSGDLGTSTSLAVSGVPEDGSTVHVKLWYKVGTNSWQNVKTTYTAASNCGGGGCTQEITSPTPGTQICNTSETFCWNECTDTSYYLGVGTSQSSVASSPYGDIFAGTVTGGRQIVNSIPSTGTLYVRFWYKEGSGSWQYNDYTYTGCN